MSLYIQPENQTYLWNTIHSHPKFQPHLRQYPPEKIAAWFRSTIEGFYRNWGEKRPISPSELKQLNQNTVTYLYQSITSLNHPQPPSTNPTSSMPVSVTPPVQSGIAQPFQQNPALPKPLPDFHGQHEFEQRAQEYQAMNAKPMATPLQGKTDADHRESQEEMERKWMEQQRLREKDIEQFSPPSQVNGPQAINLNLLKSSSDNGNMRKEEEKESIQIKIREYSESNYGGDGRGMEGSGEMKGIKEPIAQVAPLEWEKRLEHIENTQEKIFHKIEELSVFFTNISHLLQSTVTTQRKMGDIDE